MAKNVVRKRIELNQDTVDWFNNHYPEGSLSATISMLFDKFMEVNVTTPAEYASLAAAALNEEATR
jgi:hypothetical protein